MRTLYLAIALALAACSTDASYSTTVDETDAGFDSDSSGAVTRDVVVEDAASEGGLDIAPAEDATLEDEGAPGDVAPDAVRPDVSDADNDDVVVPEDTEDDTPPEEDTAPDAEPLPDPIDAPAETWTWVDIPGTQCADGSPTGMGVNLRPGATSLFIYLEGGGACWNYSNCFGLVTTALHLDGFDADTFDSLITDVYLNSLVFDREDPKNVLRDAHHVFLPYCTADIFAGDAVVELEGAFGARRTIHFKGRQNMATYLRRLRATFPDVEHVVVAGSSAGGFGAAVSWPAVRAAFPDARVDVIDDSGPPIDPAGGLWEEWIRVWNLALPPDCDDCEESVSAMRRYFMRYLGEDDGSRMAVISYTRDGVISAFMQLFPIVFEERLRAMCDEYGDEPNAQCFLVWGRLHTLLIAGMENESGGLPLWRWIEQMIEGDEDWQTAVP